MARFVLDASATLGWCFDDERRGPDAAFARLQSGDEVTVPPHWPIEVANALLTAVRRQRIPKDKAMRFLHDLQMLPIHIDRESTETTFGPAFALAERLRLTVYDAAYLELAIRERLPLATLDAELRNAARAEGVPLLDLL